MESTNVNQSASGADNTPSESATEAERLFKQFLDCKPELDELTMLLGINTLPNQIIIQAAIHHPDFNINNPSSPLLAREHILDTWEFLPIDQMDSSTAIDVIRQLGRYESYQCIRQNLGRHLIAQGKEVEKVITLIPELLQEGWDKLISLEDSDIDLVLTVHFFKDEEDKKQKMLWILQNRPNCAYQFISSRYQDVANLASTLVLDSKTPVSLDTYCQIIQASNDGRVNIILARKAADRLLDGSRTPSEKVLLAIIESDSATTEQKERAADILLTHTPDSFLLKIVDHVPSRAAPAQLALADFIRSRAEKEAARPEKDRILSQLLNL